VSTLLGELGYTVSIRQATEHVAELNKTGADPVFLAVAEGQALGLLALHLCRMLQYASPIVRVTALVVDRRARRRGVGKLLMEHTRTDWFRRRLRIHRADFGCGPHGGPRFLS
jgi:GNAT superfamily N-acetyltransferase